MRARIKQTVAKVKARDMLAHMLMEELFARGIIVVGLLGTIRGGKVGVFNNELVAGFPALRLAEMEKMKWLAGDRRAGNKVPATRAHPAYSDISTSTLKILRERPVDLPGRQRWQGAASPDVRSLVVDVCDWRRAQLMDGTWSYVDEWRFTRT
jgi:hypothetical protein